jgi:ring-1,2-phenylacetyl-CoA epoxidase subunit PaaB
MILKSLDPRVNRLKIDDTKEGIDAKPAMDQFQTYEVFQQMKEGKAYEHVGIVHAPNDSMAFLFGKEQFSRRGMFCTGIWIIPTNLVKTSDYTDNNVSVYENFQAQAQGTGTTVYEIFHLKRRGKQHIHAGNVLASSDVEAISIAKNLFGTKDVILNIWVCKAADIMKSTPEDLEMWNTLPDKKYRDAPYWKAGDKIKAFKEQQQAK